jgi:hypothetical protein
MSFSKKDIGLVSTSGVFKKAIVLLSKNTRSASALKTIIQYLVYFMSG